MKILRIGFVGLGQRGSMMLRVFLANPNVDVIAVCDVYEDRLDKAESIIKELRNHDVIKYKKFPQMIQKEKLDAVYVASSWEEHLNQAIICMENHIPVAMEVGGAYSIDE